MSARDRLIRARQKLLRAIEHGHVPTWLVDAVTSVCAEEVEGESADSSATLSRAETLLDILRAYRGPGLDLDPTRGG